MDGLATGDLRPSLLGLSRGFWKTTLANFCFFTAYYLVIPTLPLAALQVGAKQWQMGYVNAIASTVQIVLALFLVGPLINSSRRRPFLIAGGLIYAATALALTGVHRFGPFLAVGAITGVGVSFFSSTASMMVINFVPESRRGEALGLFGTLTTIAISSGPPLAIRLMQISLSAAYLTIALFSLMAVVIALTIREPAVHAGQGGAARPGFGGAAHPRVIVPALVTPALLVIGMCVMYGSLLSYFPKYAMDQGLANPGFFFTFMALAVISVRFWAGKASDRLPKGRLMIPGMVAMIITTAVVAAVAPGFYLLPMGLLFGLGYGIVYPVTQALMAEWAPPHERGSAMAMFSAAFTTGVGLGPLAAGPVLARWGFPMVFGCGSVVGLVVLLLFTRGYYQRQRERGVPSLARD